MTLRRLLTIVLVIINLCGSESRSRIQISPDGGYSNIVVKLDNDVSQQNCALYIKHLTEMLSEASGVLSRAVSTVSGDVSRGVFFKQVTIVIPRDWDQNYCRVKLSEPAPGVAYQTADILVSRAPVLSPHSPWTQHSGQCGDQGEVIIFPETFFADWNKTLTQFISPAKTLVKEWAKFRYGVFDEHGYQDDTLYPNYYKVQGKFLPTGTSNIPVKGTWVSSDGEECGDPGRGQCVFLPQGDNDEVTCSLGFLPHLAQVSHWCGLDEVKIPTAPTKHNILCGSVTSAQMISQHPDIVSVTGSPALSLSLQPSINIVREPGPKYVLMVETSSQMVESWKWTRKAVQNLVKYQLPPDSSVAIITFNSEAQTESGLAVLGSESERARVADTVPDSANKLGRTSTACVKCAVVEARRLTRGHTAGLHLVLITTALNTVLTDLGLESSVRVSVLSVAETGVSGHNTLRQLADTTGGVFRPVSRDQGELVRYTQMIQYLGEILARDHVSSGHPVTLHQRHVRSGAGESTYGSFILDTDLGRDTEFGIYVEDDEDHQIKSVTFSDSQSNIYGPFTSMSSLYDSVNLKTINFGVGDVPPFSQYRGSVWSYSIDWYRAETKRDNVVMVTSRPRDKNMINIKTWTNMNQTRNIINTNNNLMGVFVQVTHGDSPVMLARIRVNITVIMNNGSVARINNLTMLDNGFGEPDTLAGDGIYSGYVTRYSGAGTYHISVSVDDNNAKAGALTSTSAGPRSPCCGSHVPHSSSHVTRLGLFSRVVSGPSVEVSAVTTTDIRPGKIGDLGISVRDSVNGSELILQWTAPGGDINDGSVVTYRFVFSHNIEELITPGGTPPALDGLKRTDVAGTRVRHVISFPFYNQDYYIGVAASDARGNRGHMSNIVLVNIPSDQHTGVTDLPVSGRDSDLNWIMIGAIIGGVCFLVLTILLVLCICKCCRRKSRFSKDKFAKSLQKGVKVEFPSPAQSETTDTSSYESEQHQQQQQQQHVHHSSNSKPHSSTSFAANLTPTYWSASQLLGQHEANTGVRSEVSRDPDMMYRQSQELYRQNLVLPSPDHQAVYSPGYGYTEYEHHNNYGYYGSEPDQYHDYYPQYSGGHGQQHHQAGHRHSSASIYGGQYDTRPDQREIDLRNITQV